MSAKESELPRYPIYLNSFEMGMLAAVISESDKNDELDGVFLQCLKWKKKFQEEAGVTVTELGDDMIQLEDKDGTTIIRKKYAWEK